LFRGLRALGPKRRPDLKSRSPQAVSKILAACGALHGDLFVAEVKAGRIKIFRGIDNAGHPQRTAIFTAGLDQPFGISFYPRGPDPRWVYVATTRAVLRFPYRNGDLQARGAPQHILDLPNAGHTSRDIQVEPDGHKILISVGSFSNADDADNPLEKNRANILECNPDGSDLRIYAYGIRNPSFMAFDPKTKNLWMTVNERDGLGDNLVPDYITHVQRDGFYGWPWWYMGAVTRTRASQVNIPSSKIRSSRPTYSYNPTTPLWELFSTMANNSRQSSRAIFLQLSMAHGTRAFAPVMKWSEYPYIKRETSPENTRIS
jgi:glucose/arabinose dehydrogenase